MMQDYLWDRSGEPDPETVRLEQLLGQLHYSEAHRQALANTIQSNVAAKAVAACATHKTILARAPE